MGQVELLGRRPTDLARVRLWQTARESVNTILHANRRLQFQKRSQLLISTHYEPLPVAARRIGDPDHPSQSTADTQPQLHPALLTSSAMISRSFNAARLLFTEYSPPFAVQLCSLQAAHSPVEFARLALSTGPSTSPSLFVASRQWLLVPRSSFVV